MQGSDKFQRGCVQRFLEAVIIELVIYAADPFALWRNSFDASKSLPPVPKAEIELLAHSLDDLVAQIKARRTYQEHYEAIADYSFGLAPTEALLSPQWFVDFDYVDQLAERISESMTIEEQLRFAMLEGTVTEPIIVGNQVIFTSQRRDLHADQVPKVREIEPGEFEIVVRAASRPNYIQVAVLEGRLLLTNGVHKVCAVLHKRIPSGSLCMAEHQSTRRNWIKPSGNGAFPPRIVQ